MNNIAQNWDQRYVVSRWGQAGECSSKGRSLSLPEGCESLLDLCSKEAQLRVDHCSSIWQDVGKKLRETSVSSQPTCFLGTLPPPEHASAWGLPQGSHHVVDPDKGKGGLTEESTGRVGHLYLKQACPTVGEVVLLYLLVYSLCSSSSSLISFLDILLPGASSKPSPSQRLPG